MTLQEKPWYRQGFMIPFALCFLALTAGGVVQYHQYCKEQEIIDKALEGNRAAMLIMKLNGPHWFNSNRFKEAAMDGNPHALEVLGVQKK